MWCTSLYIFKTQGKEVYTSVVGTKQTRWSQDLILAGLIGMLCDLGQVAWPPSALVIPAGKLGKNADLFLKPDVISELKFLLVNK